MSKKTSGPNIILFDIETTPIEAYTWSLWPKSLSHDNIKRDWTIICGAWKKLGEKTVGSASVKSTKPCDDKQVVIKLREALVDADLIIGHNLDRFDIKKLNTRLIVHGLEPLPNIPTVDTLKLVKKVAAFSSNRLDYLAKVLIGKGKIHVDYGLWLEVLGGSGVSLRNMVTYCKEDVRVLEGVYLKLLPYSKSHPHVGVMAGKSKDSCPACGGIHMKNNGIRITAAGVKKQERQCQDCGKYSQVPLLK